VPGVRWRREENILKVIVSERSARELEDLDTVLQA
jgi:hypothetical protein